MAYHWDRLRIQNYKSIRDLQLECGSINVFIGPPNAGKSNILEAMDVVNLPFYLQNHLAEGELKGFDARVFFRVNYPEDFFHIGKNPKSTISIGGDIENQYRGFQISAIELQQFEWRNSSDGVFRFDQKFQVVGTNPGFQFINETFRFTEAVGKPTDPISFGPGLAPPFGLNLGYVLQKNEYLLNWIEENVKERGFELAIDKTNNQISIQFRLRPTLVATLPFSALSDTFRRMLFFTAAVRTASAPILTLEEPEALSYPPFISNLAQEIIQASSQKQFFISTHSPYLLNEFIDHVPHDKLAVFVCHFSKEGAQTKARRLRPEELSEVQNYGVDLFFNLDPYLHDPSEHSA